MTTFKSGFLGGTGGWSVVDGAALFGWVDNPERKGGHIAATDAGAGLWGFVAPAEWTGDLSANFGGRISYDLRLGGGTAFRDTDITITASDGSVLTYSFETLATTDWTRFSVMLDPYSGWRNSAGTIATEAEMRAVLADAASFRIRGDQVVGLDTTELDNVRLLNGKDRPGSDAAFAGPRVIQSDFMQGGEGWGFTGDLRTFRLVPDGGAALTGSKRPSPKLDKGYLEAEDQAVGQIVYLTAPAEYLGDKSDFYGGLLRYQLKIDDTSAPITDLADIVITGSDGTTLVYEFPNNPGFSWSDYQVRLHEFAHWKLGSDAGPEATLDQIQGVLADVASLAIRGEYRNGAEKVGIDAVEFSAGQARVDVYDNGVDRNLLFGALTIEAALSRADPLDPVMMMIGSETRLDNLKIKLDDLTLISDPRLLSGAIKLTGDAHTITVEDCGDLAVTGTRGGDTITVTSPRAVELLVEGGAGNDMLTGVAGKRGLVTLDGGTGNDILIGGAGRDLLKGGAGIDIMRGFGGYDRMSGGGGFDTFVHGTGDGRDTVLDFQIGMDVINLVHTGVSRFEDLHFIDGRPGGLIVRFGNGDDLQLKGIASAAELSPEDFVFGPIIPPPPDDLLSF